MGHLEQDAREFGLHARQGGWRLGLLVARNVEKGTRGGDRRANRNRDLQKVDATRFGKAAGTSADRVLRYLTAWEKAAQAGIVPAAATLSPGQEIDLDAEKLPEWSEFYTSTDARMNMASTSLISKGLKAATPEKMKAVVAALPVEVKAALVREGLADEAAANEALGDAHTLLRADAASERVKNANRGQFRSERAARGPVRVTQAQMDGAGIMRLTAVSADITRSWQAFARAWQEVFPQLSGDAKEAAHGLLALTIGRCDSTAAALRGEDVDDAIDRILAEGGTR